MNSYLSQSSDNFGVYMKNKESILDYEFQNLTQSINFLINRLLTSQMINMLLYATLSIPHNSVSNFLNCLHCQQHPKK